MHCVDCVLLRQVTGRACGAAVSAPSAAALAAAASVTTTYCCTTAHAAPRVRKATTRLKITGQQLASYYSDYVQSLF